MLTAVYVRWRSTADMYLIRTYRSVALEPVTGRHRLFVLIGRQCYKPLDLINSDLQADNR